MRSLRFELCLHPVSFNSGTGAAFRSGAAFQCLQFICISGLVIFGGFTVSAVSDRFTGLAARDFVPWLLFSGQFAWWIHLQVFLRNILCLVLQHGRDW